ncbi:MAG: rRNA pseudouridine synthase [Candidatus Omnitrophica bacterium]|nr:rRNA pseudouridine synthase [Candidatus Omnitrophota bacterium]
MGQVPLERALSKLGVMSRAETRRMIEAGRLSVNGRVIKDPSFLVIPEKVRIAVDSKPVGRAEACTIMLYKPKGLVTTRSDEKGRKTVYELLPPRLQHLHPVGRLDMATTGLLLMTTDTQLSNFLTDPGNGIPRVYAVTARGRISGNDIRRMTKGIPDKGELLKAAKASVRKASGKETHLILELNEGKNREIRRMIEAVGSQVTSLKRIAFGKLTLGTLEPGGFREVAKRDILS